MDRRFLLAPTLVALLVVGALPLPGAAQGGLADEPLTVRPTHLNRLTPDPWLGGAWIASDAGLFWKQFEVPGLVHYGVRQGLPSLVVFDAVASADAVYIGTGRGPAAVLKANNTVAPIVFPNGSVIGSPTRALLLEGDTLWFGTDTKGLFKADVTTGIAEAVPNPVNGSAFERPVLGLARDGATLFLSVPTYGLVVWERGSGEAEVHRLSLLTERTLYGRLAVRPDGVWIGTNADGTVYFQRSTERMRQYASPFSINSPDVHSIAVFGDEVYFAALGGMRRYDTRSEAWTSWQEGSGWSFNTAIDVAVIEGAVYATGLSDQVARYDRAKDAWLDAGWWDESDVPRFNNFRSCGRDGDRALFGTAGGGALWFDPATGAWTRVGMRPQDTGRPADITIHDLEVGDDTLYFATTKGVSIWDRRADAWSHHRTYEPQENREPDRVLDLHLTEDALWVASRGQTIRTPAGRAWQDGALSRLDLETGVWERWGARGNFSSQNLSQVFAHAGKVYVGTFERGLDVFDPATGTSTPLYPTNGTPEPIVGMALREGLLYVGGSSSGLKTVDPATGEVRQVPGLFGTLVTALHAAPDGTLWLGTGGEGLIRYDPATGERRTYTTGNFQEAWITCVGTFDDLLHVGSGWGLERFDPAAERFLPQGRLTGGATAPGLAPHAVRITSPSPGALLATGEPLLVEGNATGPEGAVVEVRVARGPWTAAHGLEAWSLTVPADELAIGTRSVNARLVAKGATLAQASVVVHVGAPSGGPGGPEPVAFRHAPPVTVTSLDPVEVRVVPSRDVSGLAGELVLERSGRVGRVPLAHDGSGGLATTLEPFREPLVAHYTIEVRWDGGSTLLPPEGSPYGERYPLHVEEARGFAAAHLLPAEPLGLNRGEEGSLVVVAQNTGSRPGRFLAGLTGPAAAWAETPEGITLEPGTSGTLAVPIRVPADAPPGDHTLSLTLGPDDPLAGTGTQGNYTIRVGRGLEGQPEDETGSRTPLPAPLVALALTLAALGLRHTSDRTRGRGKA